MRASLSHTGSLAGRDELYHGLFRQAGVLRVEGTEELLDASRALAFSPLPAGNRVAVLTGQARPRGWWFRGSRRRPLKGWTNYSLPWPSGSTLWTWGRPGTTAGLSPR
ncbi:MAG: hypothetical protein ACLFUE_10280 [Desulfobacteraceae bacterium]